MADANPSACEPGQFPEDLRKCVDEGTVIRLVFHALQSFEEDAAQSETAVAPGLPRILLTILTYSYAVGVYSSEEIESRIQTDPELGYLAAKTCPSASELRRFRRYHRASLQRSLSRVLELAYQSPEWTCPGEFLDRTSLCAEQFRRLQEQCNDSAEHRINDAVLMDTMALDA